MEPLRVVFHLKLQEKVKSMTSEAKVSDKDNSKAIQFNQELLVRVIKTQISSEPSKDPKLFKSHRWYPRRSEKEHKTLMLNQTSSVLMMLLTRKLMDILSMLKLLLEIKRTGNLQFLPDQRMKEVIEQD
jgi:hypothetical protein